MDLQINANSSMSLVLRSMLDFSTLRKLILDFALIDNTILNYLCGLQMTRAEIKWSWMRAYNVNMQVKRITIKRHFKPYFSNPC